MAINFAVSPELRSRTFWGVDFDSPSSERELDYAVKFSSYSFVERAKAMIRYGWSPMTWYRYESVNYRGGIFYQSNWMEKSALAGFKWKVLTPDYSRIRALYLVISAFRRGRRLEGRIRLQFHLADASRPMILIDGEHPSWTTKRVLLLGRVMASLNDANSGYCPNE